MSRFFLLHLFAAVAEMEREIIRERVRAGVRAAKAKGIALELASLPSPTARQSTPSSQPFREILPQSQIGGLASFLIIRQNQPRTAGIQCGKS